MFGCSALRLSVGKDVVKTTRTVTIESPIRLVSTSAGHGTQVVTLVLGFAMDLRDS